jgi:hypothetical protein
MEPLIRNCLPSIPQKIYNITKRLKTPQEVEKYFPGGFYLHRLHIEQSIPRPTDNKRREKIFYSGKKKRYAVKTQIMVNNRGGFIIHKTDHKKGSRGMTMIFIKRIIL